MILYLFTYTVRRAKVIRLSERERRTLAAWLKVPEKRTMARVILRSAWWERSQPIKDIAAELRISRPTAVAYRKKFLAERLEGLRSNAGRPSLPAEVIEKIAAVVRSAQSADEYRTSREFAKELGVSQSSVWRTVNATSDLKGYFQPAKRSDFQKLMQKLDAQQRFELLKEALGEFPKSNHYARTRLLRALKKIAPTDIAKRDAWSADTERYMRGVKDAGKEALRRVCRRWKRRPR